MFTDELTHRAAKISMLCKISFEKTDCTFVSIKNVLNIRIDIEMLVAGHRFSDILEGHNGHFLRYHFVVGLSEPIVLTSSASHFRVIDLCILSSRQSVVAESPTSNRRWKIDYFHFNQFFNIF